MSESGHSNVVDINSRAPRLDRGAAQLLHSLEASLLGVLDGLVQTMLDQAGDTLIDLADKAGSDIAQRLYFDAMHDLGLKRTSIENGFKAAIRTNFEAFIAVGTVGLEQLAHASPNEELSLELVDDDQVEESIALRNMAAKAERNSFQELYDLTERLRALTRSGNLGEGDHPASPSAIVRAFGETLTSLDTPIQVKLVAYKLFDKHVMSGMATVQKQLNGLLIDAGVLPKIHRTVRKNPDAGIHSGTVGTIDDTRTPGRGPFSHAGVSQGTVSGESGGLDPTGIGCFAQGGTTLVGALSSMQEYVVDNGVVDQVSPEEMTVHLTALARHIATSTEGRGASTADEKTIDMVAMIFEFVLNDESIPDAVKVLIARLQIPVLKVALIDSDFFGRKSHPARELINAMAYAGMGCNSEADGEDTLLQTIGDVVGRILSEFDDDPSIFRNLLNDFREYLGRECERASVFEERTRKTTEGRERVEYARRRTEAWIEMWTSRDDIPSFIREFLQTTWKQALLVTMHRHGESSREWASRVQTVNNLLWSISPKRTAHGGQLLVEIIPDIERELREGMELASAHPQTVELFFRELANCQAKTVNGGVVPDPERELRNPAPGDAAQQPAHGDAPPRLDEVVEEIVLASEQAQMAARDGIHDAYSEQAHALEPGTWVVFANDDQTHLRAKLSWKSPLTGCCLFVNRKGTKVAEKTLSSLAAELRAGRARILEDIPLLDRAINALWDRGAQGQPV